MAKPTLKVTHPVTGVTYTRQSARPYTVLRLETRSPVVAEFSALAALERARQAVLRYAAAHAYLSALEAGAPLPVEATAYLASIKVTGHSYNTRQAGVKSQLDEIRYYLTNPKGEFARTLYSAEHFADYLQGAEKELARCEQAVAEQVWNAPASPWSSWHLSLKNAQKPQTYSSPENTVEYLDVATGTIL